MADQTARPVRALLVPIQGSRMLLLPNAAVAEVVAMRDLESAPDDAPDWLLGTMPWRGESLTVVGYERLRGEDAASMGAGAQVVVVNALAEDAPFGYYGLVAAGIPHLLAVGEGAAETVAAPGEGGYALCDVRLNESRASIPDLDAIEARVAESR
ncbi:MAG: chemotaxis protein CheW [Gammaproteobacteria bacterium]|nr:chemotaxis protein CheW [Gammaproteobacteria bacterium]